MRPQNTISYVRILNGIEIKFKMKKIKVLFILGMVCGVFAITTINISKNASKKSDLVYGETCPIILKKAGYYTPGKIYINGITTWASASINFDWCSGVGTLSDPYIIEDCVIDGGNSGSCIFIENSDVSFIIRNCTLFNSGNESLNAGILLNNVSNSKLLDNNCSFNLNSGIYLNNSRYNTLSGNTINNNSNNGFALSETYLELLNNSDTVRFSQYSGIYLEKSNHNNITGNSINYNFIGVLLNESNYNVIKIAENDFIGNRGALFQYNCVGNDLGYNNSTPNTPIEVVITIIIISIVIIIVVGVILQKRQKNRTIGIDQRENKKPTNP